MVRCRSCIYFDFDDFSPIFLVKIALDFRFFFRKHLLKSNWNDFQDDLKSFATVGLFRLQKNFRLEKWWSGRCFIWREVLLMGSNNVLTAAENCCCCGGVPCAPRFVLETERWTFPQSQITIRGSAIYLSSAYVVVRNLLPKVLGWQPRGHDHHHH